MTSIHQEMAQQGSWYLILDSSEVSGATPLARWISAGCLQSPLGNGPCRHDLCNPCIGAKTRTAERPLGLLVLLPLKKVAFLCLTRVSGKDNSIGTAVLGDILATWFFTSGYIVWLLRLELCAIAVVSRIWFLAIRAFVVGRQGMEGI